MAAKFQIVTELYLKKGKEVTSSPLAWQNLLASACRNYKLRFDEQLLVYAQRPDAIAVLETERWNKGFSRWVNRGATGIAVFAEEHHASQRLTHYFDISDTHETRYSRPVPIWEMKEEYTDKVIETLEHVFGTLADKSSFAGAIQSAARIAVEDNLPDYQQDLIEESDGSFLEELPEEAVADLYRRLVTNSVAYMIMTRLGIDTKAYFEPEDFQDVINFNTVKTLNGLGKATSNIAEVALREIAKTVTALERQSRIAARGDASSQPERSQNDGKVNIRTNGRHIPERGRLLSSELDSAGSAGKSGTGNMVGYAENLSQGTSPDQVYQSSDKLHADRTPFGRTEESERTLRDIGGTDGRERGRGRSDENAGSDEVGRTDEQLPERSTGDRAGTDHLRITDEKIKPIPSVEKQVESIEKAEDEKSSAFSVSQEDIDSVLTSGSLFQNGKYRIYRQFQKHEDDKSNIDFLKKEYGTGGGTHSYPDGTRGHAWHDSKGIGIEKYDTAANPSLHLSWPKVEKRLRELIRDDRYLNPKEKDHYADYLESVEAPQYEIDTQRKMARQRFIDANRDLPLADKRDTLALRLSDFIRDLDHYEKNLLENVERTDLADVTAEQMEQHLGNPATVQQLIDFLALVQGKTADVYSRSNAWRFSQELMELYPLRYVYHLGDTVYIGASEYEILSFDEKRVMLYDTQFPLLNKEMERSEFDQMVQENPLNDHLKAVSSEEKTKQAPAAEKTDTDQITESKKHEILQSSLEFRFGEEEPDPDGWFTESELLHNFVLNNPDCSFALANAIVEYLDEKQHRERIDKELHVGWYEKTYFTIHAAVGEDEFTYEGRCDIGDGKGEGGGSLIDHIRNWQQGIIDSDKYPYSDAARKEHAQRTLNVLIPFLESHAEMTQEEKRVFDDFKEQHPIRTLEKPSPSVSDLAVGDLILYDGKRREIEEISDESISPLKNLNAPDHDGVHLSTSDVLAYDGWQKDMEEKGFEILSKAESASDLQPQIVAYYKSDDENIVIVQAPNGKYFNHYGYDENNNSFASTAGGFDTFEEAEQTLYAHRPTAIDITEEKQTLHYTIELTSDAFADPFIIRDNTVPYGEDGQYYDVDGIYQTFETEEEAQEYADTLNSAENIVKLFAQKDEERSQQEQPDIQDNSDLIGKEILIDNRRYVVESISEISGDVSMRDITFANAVGFPINRVEKIGYIRSLLSKAQEEKQPEKAVSPVLASSEPRYNYRITEDTLGVGGAKEKFRNNMAAINLLHELELENRLATPEEQEILSKYVGWGGLSMAFDENNASWADEFTELYTTLSPDEYAAARKSTLTAFFTPPDVIRAIYDAMEQMGFQNGNLLEPSCGVGNFIGMLPQSMRNIKVYGIELDTISAGIAQQLYQKSSIAAQGFEEVRLPDNFFDGVVGNVPFGDFKVADKKYDKYNFLIHDYFFAKSLDMLRPGGIMALITSKGTMDKKNPKVRKYIAQRAKLLGAIRLPNNTFKGNAGTEVVSDILFLQKRDRIIEIEPDWVHLGKNNDGVVMNEYFIQHPEMILGEMKMVSGRFGEEVTCVPFENADLSQLLSEAVTNIHGEIRDYEIEEEQEEADLSIPADPEVKNFSYTVLDDRLYYRENSRMKPVEVSKTVGDRIKDMIVIRDCVRQLIDLQLEDYPDEEIQTARDKLNMVYDSCTKKHGLINSRANTSAFSDDASFPLLKSLENIDEDGNLVSKADIFYKRTIRPHKPVTEVDTASDALAVSLGEKGKVDMTYMQQLTGRTEEEIALDLRGVIFKDFDKIPGGAYTWKTADAFLSGNVREKLAYYREVLETLPKDSALRSTTADNVAALEQVQPEDLTASEISVRLGATWLPTDVIKQFMVEILQENYWVREQTKVTFTPYTGNWHIDGKSYDKNNVRVYSTYGTARMNAYEIIEQTLNLKDVRVYDYVEDEVGKKKAILNKKETALAQAKQEAVKQAFQDWIWKDPGRREALTKLYNERFNSIRPREYDGSHIVFSGMNPEIKLREHQRNAVAHILYGGNTLLAHAVGAGKTFEMASAAMESKRLGLCTKSLFVVPNHLTEQWAAEFLQLYPAANILVSTKKDFETKNRKKFCGRIATGDYDAVIIGHSQFEKIPISVERHRQMLEQQIEELTDCIATCGKDDRFSVKEMEKLRQRIRQQLESLHDQSDKDDVVTFEELGIDRLFIDESHFYKNLYLYTKMRNVGGIAQTEAKKSSDLFMKCRYLDEVTEGRGVVFATGTPISNSMVELYTIQRYLQYNRLVESNLQYFDAWASTFGETVTAAELAPEGTKYRTKTRFAKFYNLPELMAMFKEVADIKTADMLDLPVPDAEYHTISVEPSDMQKEMLAELGKRADKVRNGMVDSTEDNMLSITNDGKKLALDQRMINPMLPDFAGSKVNACVENVYQIWEETEENRLTQLVFCDLSTPKNDGTFSVYNDIRKKLIEKGIPKEEIAFIHDANTDIKKEQLFQKVRDGRVRVLLGSTQKMGAGTNVQDRLIALHDLDCPWRPSDLQQRSGRIIRQGNKNQKIHIFRYVTKDTFDAYLYQLIESKQKFVSQIMTSKSPVRSAEDVDAAALSYAEIKACCISNPYLKEKMDLDIQVQKLKLLKSGFLSEKYALEDKILKEYPARIAGIENRIDGLTADVETAKQHPKPMDDRFVGMEIKGIFYSEKADAGKAILKACKEMTNPAPIPLGSYRGFCTELFFDKEIRSYCVTVKGKTSRTVSLGEDVFGNITRIDNVIERFPDALEKARVSLMDTQKQLETAREEVQKPFAQEEELQNKIARLNEINIMLGMEDVPEHDGSSQKRNSTLEL